MAFRKRKVCRFCADSSIIIDYKNKQMMEAFITERAKIVPSRISGSCPYHQRELSLAIKHARHISIIPYSIHAS